jgi:hypothetical protein
MKKKQHFTSRFYLEGFTDDKSGKITEYILPQNRIIKTYPPLAGAGKYLYTVIKKDGTKDNSLENLFEFIETNSAPALKRCIQDPSLLSEIDKEWILQFVAFQYLRVPASMANTDQLLQQAFYSELIKMTNDPVRFRNAFNSSKNNNISESEIKDFIRRGEEAFKIEMPKQNILGAQLAMFKTVFPLFYGMKWKILTSSGDAFFFTSDNPVVSFLGNNKVGVIMSGGFTHKEIQVTFPLSKNVCLSGQWLGKENFKHVTVGPRAVKRINERTIGNAEKYLYASQITPELKELIIDLTNMKKSQKEDIAKRNKRKMAQGVVNTGP